MDVISVTGRGPVDFSNLNTSSLWANAYGILVPLEPNYVPNTLKLLAHQRVCTVDGDGRVTVTLRDIDLRTFSFLAKAIRKCKGPVRQKYDLDEIDRRLFDVRIEVDTKTELVASIARTPLAERALAILADGFVFNIETQSADVDLTRMFFNNMLRGRTVSKGIVDVALLHDENGPLGDLVARYRLVAATIPSRAEYTIPEEARSRVNTDDLPLRWAKPFVAYNYEYWNSKLASLPTTIATVGDARRVYSEIDTIVQSRLRGDEPKEDIDRIVEEVVYKTGYDVRVWILLRDIIPNIDF